jgi:copper chaperone
MIELNVPDMHCGHCVAMITKAVKAVDEGAPCEVDLGTKSVLIDSALPPSDFVEALEEAGYAASLTRAVG